MRFLQNISAFLFVMIAVWACQTTPDDTPVNIQAPESRRVVSIEDIPHIGNALFSELGFEQADGKFSLNNGSQNADLNIQWDEIKMLVDSTGRETYTFGIKHPQGNPYSFYNLILRVSPNGDVQRPYILNYEMDEAFIPVYHETRSLANFQGTVRKIILDAPPAFHDMRGLANIEADTTNLLDGTTCPNKNRVFAQACWLR